jgi:putative transcriptional regulator
MQEIRKKVGKRITQLRRKRRLSQQDLAHECGFDKSYLRAVECGEKNITFARMYRIARALRVSLFELFKAM